MNDSEIGLYSDEVFDPRAAASEICFALKECWVSYRGEASEKEFEEECLGPLLARENLRGIDLVNETLALIKAGELDWSERMMGWVGLRVAVGYCLEMDQAAHEGKLSIALRLFRQASYWHGFTVSALSGADPMRLAEKIISDRARDAALVGHKENHANKRAAFEWLEENFDAMGLTIDRAAEQLARIVPVEFSTRRAYVKEWKKARQ